MGATTCIWGRPGTGKTTALVKTAARPLLLIDEDKKSHTMYNLEKDLADPEVIVLTMPHNLQEGRMANVMRAQLGEIPPSSEPKGYMWTVELLEKLIDEPVWPVPGYEQYRYIGGLKEVPTEPVDLSNGTVGLDSYTRFLEHMKRFLLFAAKKDYVTSPGWGKWLMAQEFLLNGVPHLAPDFVMICHEKLIRDDVNGEIKTLPHIEGSMSDKLSSYLQEMYHAEIRMKGNKAEYVFRTVDDKLQCRTSRDIETVVEADLERILRNVVNLGRKK